MKKFFIFFTLLFLFISSAAFAGGNQNQSADWVSTLSRNASTDTDSAFFNPAGTAQMDQGLYLYFDYQCIIQPITIESSGALNAAVNKDFEGSKSAYYFGNLYLSYVKDNIGPGTLGASIFFLPSGGGGGGKYEDGVPVVIDSYNWTTNVVSDMSLEATSAMYAFQINVSYAFLNKMLSLSAGYRFLYYVGTYEGTIVSTGGTDKLDVEQKGAGHGVIVGLSAQPIKSENKGTLTIGLRYEWHSVMETETTESNSLSTAEGTGLVNGMGLNDGAKGYQTLPQTLTMGVGYSNWGLNLMLSFNYYLESVTQYSDDNDGKDLDEVDDWSIGIGGKYTMPMLPLHIGLGFQYYQNNHRQSQQSELDENLSSYSIGVGIGYTFIEKITLTLAYNFAYYDAIDVNDGNSYPAPISQPISKSNFYKTSHDISFGLEYKIL